MHSNRTLAHYVLFTLFLVSAAAAPAAQPCRPTPADSLGPFYEPDAPVRESVGSGYRLTGAVRSAADCAPIPAARVELWLAGPDGTYRDDFRATVFSDPSGRYRFESHFPPNYYGRPPHIHIKVTADKFKPLITQHYPDIGTTNGNFDLVLVPK
jgi:protocatechuate 3,4-dioxygenase beta subunit